MSKFEYKHLSHHFQFTSQESKMIATPASVERVEKCVFNFEIYRFLKKGQFTPFSPTQLVRVGTFLILGNKTEWSDGE